MNSDSTVFDFASVAVVLPVDGGRMTTTFGGSRFIDGADGVLVSVIAGDDLLTSIPQLFFIPLDRFEKPL